MCIHVSAKTLLECITSLFPQKYPLGLAALGHAMYPHFCKPHFILLKASSLMFIHPFFLSSIHWFIHSIEGTANSFDGTECHLLSILIRDTEMTDHAHWPQGIYNLGSMEDQHWVFWLPAQCLLFSFSLKKNLRPAMLRLNSLHAFLTPFCEGTLCKILCNEPFQVPNSVPCP